MNWEKGTVVKGLCGHEKDHKLCVVGSEQNFILLADGKKRKIEKPKRKNPKHVELLHETLNDEQMQTNKALRQALK